MSEFFMIYSREIIHKHFTLNLLSVAASGRTDSLMGEATIEFNTRKKIWIFGFEKFKRN